MGPPRPIVAHTWEILPGAQPRVFILQACQLIRRIVAFPFQICNLSLQRALLLLQRADLALQMDRVNSGYEGCCRHSSD